MEQRVARKTRDSLGLCPVKNWFCLVKSSDDRTFSQIVYTSKEILFRSISKLSCTLFTFAIERKQTKLRYDHNTLDWVKFSVIVSFCFVVHQTWPKISGSSSVACLPVCMLISGISSKHGSRRPLLTTGGKITNFARIRQSTCRNKQILNLTNALMKGRNYT